MQFKNHNSNIVFFACQKLRDCKENAFEEDFESKKLKFHYILNSKW